MIVGSTVLLWSATTHLLAGQIWDHVASDIFGRTAGVPSSAKEVWTEVPVEVPRKLFAVSVVFFVFCVVSDVLL